MSQKNRSELRKKDFLVVKQTKNQNIAKIITPQTFQIGLDDSEFQSGLIVKGSAQIGGRLLDKAGQPFIKSGGAVTVTEDAAGGVTISATLGNGAVLSGGGAATGITAFTYDGSSTATVGIDLDTTRGGLAFDSSRGLQVKPSASNSSLTSGTVNSADLLLIEDVSSGVAGVKKITVNNLMSAASSLSSLGNVLTLGDGTYNRIGAQTYNNTSAVTVNVATGSLGGLSIIGGPGSGGALKVDPNNATLASLASNDTFLIYDTNAADTRKVTAQDVANIASAYSLSAGSGLTYSVGSAYNGSANTTISLDTSTLVLKASNNAFTGKNTFGVSTTAGLTGSIQEVAAGVPYLVGGSNVSITTGSNGQLTIAASIGSGGTLSSGNGIGSFTFNGTGAAAVSVDASSLSTTAADRSNFAITAQNGSLSTISKTTLGSIADAVDRTAIMAAGSGINIAFNGNANPAVISTIGPAPGDPGSGNSDKAATYLVLSATGSLDNERVFTYGTGITGSDSGAGNAFTVGVRNDVVATLTGSVFTGDLVAQSGLSGSIQMLSDGTTPYIIGTGSVSVTTSSSGQLVISSSGGSGGGGSGSSTVEQSGGSSFNNITTFIFTGSTVSNSGASVTITPVIGAAEDSSYLDGLFTDFSYTTPIGTAVDRFNEVLKGLAPSAAPSLDDVSCSDSGTGAKLSFGNTQSITGYTNARPSTLSPASSLSDVDINGSYSSAITGNDVRVACFSGATVIDGVLNADVTADSPNYPADAFGNGDQGTLKLFVNNNATEKHSTDLSSFGSGTSANSNGSGFVLSAVSNGAFSDGSAFSTFKHRTGTYTIAVADQVTGWNYARVVHTIGGNDTTTNYVEWVNDPDSNALSADNSAMDGLSMTGTKQLSGVTYNTAGTAQYRVRALNAYRNVYSTSNITFNGTNCTIPSQAFPAIDHASSENETKMLQLTGSATINADPLLNESITVSVNVPAPLKSNLSSAGSKSIAGILLYNLSDTASVTSEPFRGESYRRASGSYDNQAAVTDSGAVWNSATSLTTIDGLLFYDSTLRAPRQGIDSGDFRNTSDGGSIANGPSSNVNYSSISSGIRTFYRYFQNNSGGSKTNFALTLNGTGTIVKQSTSLSTSNIHVLAKIPETSAGFTTGWMDAAVAFATGQNGDGAGCLNGALDSSLNATNNLTFGTQSVGSNEYIVIKIEADASWTGNISQMSITWS